MHTIRHESKQRRSTSLNTIQQLVLWSIDRIQFISPSSQDLEGLLLAPVSGSGRYESRAFWLSGELKYGYCAMGTRDFELAFETYGDFGEGIEDELGEETDGCEGVGEGVFPDQGVEGGEKCIVGFGGFGFVGKAERVSVLSEILFEM